MNTYSMIFQKIADGTFKADALMNMDILYRIEGKLAGKEDILSLAIKNSIHNNTPAKVIIRNIAEMAMDNFNMTADLLGISLTNKILYHAKN